MKSCVNISLAILLAVLVSFAGAEAFAKGNEPLKTAPEATNVKRPATSLAIPQKPDPALLSSELKRLLIRGEANFILATSSDIKALSDVTRCPNCTKILAGLEGLVRKGELPKEALAVAAIDPNNPILLAAVNQANPQLGEALIQIPTAAKPGVSGANFPGSSSMGIQVGVDAQTGLPKVTGVQTGQENSGREALRAGFGLEYLRLSNGVSSSAETGSGGSSFAGVRNPFLHSDESDGAPSGGDQRSTSINSDGLVTEQTEVTSTSNDTEVVVTTGLYGSSVVIQPRESSPSILQTWGNALRDLFGERTPTVQREEDPNTVSAPSAAALGITAPQTLLDAANLRFSGQIDRGDASTTASENKTENSGIQAVESADQRSRPSTAGFVLPQSTTQAAQLRLGNVTQPTENGGNNPSGGSFNLGSIDFCNPAVVSDLAAGGTPPCH